MLNPGFGARVKLSDSAYVGFEMGLAGFTIPFVNLCFGWEPAHHAKKRAVLHLGGLVELMEFGKSEYIQTGLAGFLRPASA